MSAHPAQLPGPVVGNVNILHMSGEPQDLLRVALARRDRPNAPILVLSESRCGRFHAELVKAGVALVLPRSAPARDLAAGLRHCERLAGRAAAPPGARSAAT